MVPVGGFAVWPEPKKIICNVGTVKGTSVSGEY